MSILIGRTEEVHRNGEYEAGGEEIIPDAETGWSREEYESSIPV